MRRWRERLEEEGYDGLADRRKGRVSPKRVALETCERVLRLYRERYFDLNMRHFHEKLKEEHGIELSYTWVQTALQGAGLVAKRSKRGTHRRRRPRRPMTGMLLHIDGSKHCWFEGGRRYDLIVILDDANDEIYYAQLVEEESTRTVMAALREVIETKGVFCALYSDRGSHFFWTPKAGEPVDKHRLTQVGRVMKELGVQMIPAYSPKHAGVRNGTSGRGKGACRKSFGWPESARSKRRIAFCASTTSTSSTASLRWLQNRRPVPSGVRAARIWIGCSRCRQSVRSPRTTPSPSATECGSWRSLAFAVRWPAAPSPFMNTWMAGCRCAMDRTWSDDSTAKRGR